MKKFYFIISSLVIVAIAAYYLHQTRSSTLQRRDSMFHITDISAIDRITIIADNQSVTLDKEGNKWDFNNVEINQERLNDLLILANKIEAVSPAAKSDLSILTEKLNAGTNVSFYSGRKLINSYQLCISDMKIFASRNKSEKIFRIEARGYPNVDLTKIFSADPMYWTNRKIINFSPEEITKIEMYYPDKPEKSFKFIFSSGVNRILTDHKETDLSGSADQEIISVYLHFFGNIPLYSLSEIEKPEITDLNQPFFILNIESKYQSGIELYGFKKINPENYEIDKTEFYGKLNEKEAVKLKYADLDPVLLELKDFLKK